MRSETASIQALTFTSSHLPVELEFTETSPLGQIISLRAGALEIHTRAGEITTTEVVREERPASSYQGARTSAATWRPADLLAERGRLDCPGKRSADGTITVIIIPPRPPVSRLAGRLLMLVSGGGGEARCLLLHIGPLCTPKRGVNRQACAPAARHGTCYQHPGGVMRSASRRT